MRSRGSRAVAVACVLLVVIAGVGAGTAPTTGSIPASVDTEAHGSGVPGEVGVVASGDTFHRGPGTDRVSVDAIRRIDDRSAPVDSHSAVRSDDVTTTDRGDGNESAAEEGAGSGGRPTADLDGPVTALGDHRGAADRGTNHSGGGVGVAEPAPLPGPTGRSAGSEPGITVRLVVAATDRRAIDPGAVRALNGTVHETTGRRVEVSMPASAVRSLRRLPWVASARLAPQAIPTALSEGVRVTNASAVHDIGVTGENVTVGVLDNGFDTSNANVSRGLIEARTFGTSLSSGADHGTATAETVAETAPDAGLYLAAFEGSTAFVEAVEYLERQEVDVIVLGVAWLYQPSDGTGFVSRTAANAVANGSVWVNPAGNYARQHWQGQFGDPDGDGYHNFRGTDDEVNNLGDMDARFSDDDRYTLETDDSVHVVMEWDDWPSNYADGAAWRDQSADLDLYVFNSSGTVVASSTRSHGTFGVPIEEVRFDVPRNDSYGVAVYNNSSRPVDVDVELYTLDSWNPQFLVESGSLLGPATREEVVTVGAADHATGELEQFSSRGPTDDGRRGVDLVGPDATASDVYPDGYTGTSASAAHVAGVAALVRAANRSASPAAVDGRLKSSARLPPEFSTPNEASGYGAVDATGAVRPYLSVAGRLTDAGGTRLGDRQVTLRNRTDRRRLTAVTTGTDGRFDLPVAAAPGTLTVGPDPDGSGIGAGVTPADGVPDVYALGGVDGPTELEVGTVRLPSAHPVRVRTVTDRGEPVANATVTAVHRANDSQQVGATDTTPTARLRLVTNETGTALVGGDGAARFDAAGNLTLRIDPTGGETVGEELVTRSRRVDSPWNLTVQVGTPANLSATNLTVPTRVDRQTTANVSARIRNTGGTVGNRTQVALRVDTDRDGRLEDREEVDVTAVEVPPDGNRTVWLDFLADIEPGTYTVGVRVDGEVSPLRRNLTVTTDAPFVRVTGLSGPREAAAGTQPIISADLENVGDSPAAQRVELRVDRDGDGQLTPEEAVDDVEVGLNASESTNVALDANTSGLATGDYRYGVVTANDSATETIRIREPANLSVSIDAPPSVARGTPLDVGVTIANRGGVTWDGNVSLRLDRDGDRRARPNETVATTGLSVNPGSTETVTLTVATADLSVRSYRIDAIAADDAATTNVSIRTAPPELTVEYFQHPDRFNRTDSREFYVSVHNGGGIRGRPWTVDLRLDRDDSGRATVAERLDAATIDPGRGGEEFVRLQANVRGLDERYYTFVVTTPNETRGVRLPVGDPSPFPYGVPGGSTNLPPTNVDGDPQLEDVTGDGKFNFVDVIELVFADYAAINADPDMRRLLDFSGDGTVNFVDVIDLVFELQTRSSATQD
jgi:hypothetical protein